MSALDQKQTLALQKAVSAFPPKVDMCGAAWDVRFGPKADIGQVPHDAATIMQTRSGLMVADPRKIEDEQPGPAIGCFVGSNLLVCGIAAVSTSPFTQGRW